METTGLERIVCEHPFFADLEAGFCTLVCGCDAGEYLFREGRPADQFYLVRHGRVALEVKAPGRGSVAFQTVSAGQVAGVSWLVPPYRWAYDAKALELVRAVAMDATCLRDKCETDHDLGYELMKRFVPVLVERLHSTQLQILDVYGTPA
jgi:CRP/FNR family cyclic AMP-dependent transcriptional regulator